LGYKIISDLKVIKIILDAEKGLYKNSIVTSTGLMLFPKHDVNAMEEKTSDDSELERYFLNPRTSVKPWCFRMWTVRQY